MFTRAICFITGLRLHRWVQGDLSLLWQAVVSLAIITPFVFSIFGVKYFGKADFTYGIWLFSSFFGGVFFLIAVIAALLKVAWLIARRKFEKTFDVAYRPPFKEGEKEKIRAFIHGGLRHFALVVHRSPQGMPSRVLLKAKKDFRQAHLVASTIYGNHGCSAKIRDYVKMAEKSSWSTCDNNKYEEDYW